MRTLGLAACIAAAGLGAQFAAANPGAAAGTVLTVSGNGLSGGLKSRVFAVRDSWQIRWQFNCAQAKAPADFHVVIFKPNGTRSRAHAIHLRQPSGAGTTHYVHGGAFYLLVHSPCRWTATVLGTLQKVPPPSATPMPAPLADVSGTDSNLNEIMEIGIVLGPAHFCCFSESAQTFLAPAHFKIEWLVSCKLGAGGSGSNFHLADFNVVGYDGRYQSENLYTADNAGYKSGTTFIDTTTSKRWAFVVSDADKQQCTWRFTARNL